MTGPVSVAAVDLGATSGRVMIGTVGRGEVSLRPVARFPNGPVERPDGLHWDIDALREHVVAGLAEAVRADPTISSVGIDSWAVDYGLLRGRALIAPPFHYRDERTAVGVERVHAIVPADELYRRTGLQHLPFNTVFQLAAEGDLDTVERMLLIPDLFAFWLSGRAVAERTNASTTGLLSVATGEWDDELVSRLGLPRRILPELVDPGTTLGPLTPAMRSRIGGDLDVVAVGSHDTASAVVAVPATADDVAYISCGTWGLVGVELERPVLTEASRAANFTNEGGVDGRIRFLHNVMGLWLLSESLRAWGRDDLPELLAAAAEVTGEIPVFDANDPAFLAPGDMPARIATWFADRDLRAPDGPVAMVRSIVESLAVAFADAVRTASALSGRSVSAIHLVGGGSQNDLLCELTARHAGMPVLAGPVEATAIGNVLVQARATGAVTGSLESLRALVAAAYPPRRFDPR